MYFYATSTSISPLRFFVVCTLLFLGAVKVGYGQRVYANATEVNCNYNLLTCLNGVQNGPNAVGGNHNTSSDIIVTLSGSAWQSLRFTGAVTPTSKSPITIKLQAPIALLNLLGGVRIQKTRGSGTNRQLIGTEYRDDQLLDLLGLLSGGSYEFQMPVEYDSFDGVRVYMNSTLGVLTTVNYFYAFFIVPPQLVSPSAEICENESATIQLSHFEPGYKYNVYSTETGGAPIAETASSPQIPLPEFATEGIFTYWVEAVDSDTYVSARVPFTVTVHPKPPTPHIVTQ